MLNICGAGVLGLGSSSASFSGSPSVVALDSLVIVQDADVGTIIGNLVATRGARRPVSISLTPSSIMSDAAVGDVVGAIS